MATSKLFVILFALLSVTLAQENSSDTPASEGPEGPHAASSASSLFDNFPFKAPQFEHWPEIFGFGTRHKRSIEEPVEIEEHSREKRAVVSCNYATQGGFRCTGCHTTRRCYPFNRGVVSTCSGLLPYCYNGFCSTIKGPLCTATAATTTTASSSGSSGSADSSDSSDSDSSDSTSATT